LRTEWDLRKKWSPLLTCMVASTALLATGFVVAMATSALGHLAKQGIDDYTELIVAMIAAAACARAALRTAGRHRLGWGLLSLSIWVWAAGQLIWTYYESIQNIDVPFPSLADAGYLGFVPVAIAGALCFGSARRYATTRARSLLDGLSTASALLIVSWATVLGTVYTAGSDVNVTNIVALAYPASDIIIVTVMIGLEIGRAHV
jgi:diguanylate cyclase